MLEYLFDNDNLIDPKLKPFIEDLLNNKNNYDQNNEKLSQLIDTFFSILDDFMKYYVFYNKNPDYEEYSNLYYEKKNQIQQINTELFKLKNSIENETQKINNNVFIINEELEKQKIKNKKLKEMLKNIKKVNNGSDELIDDYKEIYKLNYIYNIAMFLGIVISGGILISITRKPINTK